MLITGCDGTTRLTSAWAQRAGVDRPRLYQALASRGGYCDCEVLMNAAESDGHDGFALVAGAIDGPLDEVVAGLEPLLRQVGGALRVLARVRERLDADLHDLLPVRHGRRPDALGERRRSRRRKSQTRPSMIRRRRRERRRLSFVLFAPKTAISGKHSFAWIKFCSP